MRINSAAVFTADRERRGGREDIKKGIARTPPPGDSNKSEPSKGLSCPRGGGKYVRPFNHAEGTNLRKNR